MKNIGKTPLLRARNLEKHLGIKKIYLKLEGNNPNRSKYDRLAKTVISAALASYNKTIIADGDKFFIKALNNLCEDQRINLLVPMHKGEKWKVNLLGEKVVDLIDVKKKALEVIYDNLQQENNAFMFLKDEVINRLSLLSYEEIGEELISRYENEIETVFFYKDNDYTEAAYNNAFLKANIINRSRIPQVFGVKEKKKAVLENQNVNNVNESLIKTSALLLQKLEHLKIKDCDAIAFAGFLEQIKLNKVKTGRHIIILDCARTKVSINQIEDFSSISKKQLIDYVDNYLDRYSDSKTETKEAIEQAVNKGYILTASSGSVIDGVVVIVHMGFDKFIPTYHLAYIGINPNSKGRGIGSELIKEAINLTNGNISLHVDLDNKNAKKLYKKMGFKHIYDRMIFQSDEK